ncbi:MAG: ATP-binding cassette domain-containing protein [Bacteroidales bacterium]|nr:ATP-binding cassette domain-containing protein [Bacteroidales bacterium]
MQKDTVSLRINNAAENNLKSVCVDIPLHKFVVITGVSGSGKSSLAFDVIVREGQRRYLESVPGFARRFTGKLFNPKVDAIENLPAVIAISQKSAGGGARSTLGTMSDLYDYLRLLFARLGKSNSEIKLSRSLFSFNSSSGACPQCTGLGLEEKISIKKLISSPDKSLRQGAIATTLPTGYIMYTQLTMDSMDMVCRAHGFSVDSIWNDLTEEQKQIVLFGSDKIKVPIGKHTLESRLKWEGIPAKPREEDYYKGIINIMSDILRRDRNPNILKYAESVKCSFCYGSRLNQDALSVRIQDKNIFDLCEIELSELKEWLNYLVWDKNDALIAKPIIASISNRIDKFEMLGMGHLCLSNPTDYLSPGETKRIRLINQITSGLSDVLYVFDEAFVGLHPHDHNKLIKMLRQLVNNGNTVVLVEHDENCIRQADYIVDIGPLAGINGGQVIFAGTPQELLSAKEIESKSFTAKALNKGFQIHPILTENKELFYIKNANSGNLKQINVKFRKSALNVITGLSGSGKQALVYDEIIPLVQSQINGDKLLRLENLNGIKQIHIVSRQPIGRTPRSNPATYTKLSDYLRDLFASSTQAKITGLSKSHFSFNTKGGRCETCMGAGKIQIGMHFLGNVDLECPGCRGKRFKPEILTVKINDKSIADVYDMTVNQATEFFSNEKKILSILHSLQNVGLGYIHLGQSSTTLSGGEAQRVKLATHLAKSSQGKSLFILDEPSNGLHQYDTSNIIDTLAKIIANDNTIICIADNLQFLKAANHIVELGPDRGKNGGYLIAQGNFEEVVQIKNSLTSNILLRNSQNDLPELHVNNHNASINIIGAETHNLKNIDISIPKGQITVIAGVSGSGKSSLAIDTIAAEAETRFNESMSVYARSFLQQSNPAIFNSITGLTPVMTFSAESGSLSERSTVGTITGLYDYYRLLYSRIAQIQEKELTARDFSFNHQAGACPVCNGLGYELKCNPDILISRPHLSILEGAISDSSTARYFGNPDGQFVAILKEAAQKNNINIDLPYQDLDKNAKDIILYGTGEIEYNVDWHFKTKSGTGLQKLKDNWPGFCYYIEDEYRRKHQNKTASVLKSLMHKTNCSSCNGDRLKKELLDIRINKTNISELSRKSLSKALVFLKSLSHENTSNSEWKIISEVLPRIINLLEMSSNLGISYLSSDRSSESLSGGEIQRVRLVGAISSPLFGITYILDEPSKGLHHDDIRKMIEVLKKIKERGNTVIIVEHDSQFMLEADYLIELGKGAGEEGGQVIASGHPKEVQKEETITAKFLKKIEIPEPAEIQLVGKKFGVRSAFANNLKHIDVDFYPVGLIAVSGVSGSGKSSLVRDVIIQSLQAKKAVNCDAIFGFEQFTNIRYIDKKLNVNAYSSVLTVSGLMDDVRDVFAGLAQSKSKKMSKSYFSYLHKDGKCPDCNGHGVKHIAMDFMSEINVVCETCSGLRFNQNTLQVRYKEKNIGEVLKMTIAEIQKLFSDHKQITRKFNILKGIGLGHLVGGQSVMQLSAGEKQRLKLCSELINQQKNKTLYIFDEPASGLHYYDILKLVAVFKQLAISGHCVLYIDHRQEMINVANQHLILGPGAGEFGGNILYSTALGYDKNSN